MKQQPGEFSRKVVELAVAAGGHPILAQMVTSILGKSDKRNEVPWHRIVYSSGKIWTDPRVDKIRKKLYQAEGIKLDKNKRIIDFEKIIYTF